VETETCIVLLIERQKGGGFFSPRSLDLAFVAYFPCDVINLIHNQTRDKRKDRRNSPEQHDPTDPGERPDRQPRTGLNQKTNSQDKEIIP
jgi:hypothetical protein